MTEMDDRPWYRRYEELDSERSLEPYPDGPLHELLYAAAEDSPDKGLHQHGAHVTYPELVAAAERMASALAGRGIEPGDRVATVLPTSVQFVVATHGTTMAGGVHVPNDFLDATEDLVYRLEQAEPTVLIGHDEHLDLLFELRDRIGIEHLIVTSVADYSADPPEHEPLEDAEWWPTVLAEADRSVPAVEVTGDDLHTILFTGGTTGRPKGCLLAHRNVYANVHQLTGGGGEAQSIADMVSNVLLALPMYHTYGYLIGAVLVGRGMDVVLVDDPRETDRMVDLIHDHALSVVMGVPAQFIDLVEEDLERPLIGISGSAPLAGDTQDRFAEDHLAISQGYGLSEMLATHVNLGGIREQLGMADTEEPGFDRPSIGVPLPDTDAKLVDVDTGEEIPLDRAAAEGLEGEMYLNGPQRMEGYLDSSRDPFDADGFVATGDVVKLDPIGRFYVVDRVKDMINVSGLKVYSEEVDEVLLGHPDIRAAATVGVPDPDRPGSERVAVYVEPATDADLTEAAIREHLEGAVAKHAMPAVVGFVDSLPRTDVGKVDKKRLREEL